MKLSSGSGNVSLPILALHIGLSRKEYRCDHRENPKDLTEAVVYNDEENECEGSGCGEQMWYDVLLVVSNRQLRPCKVGAACFDVYASSYSISSPKRPSPIDSTQLHSCLNKLSCQPSRTYRPIPHLLNFFQSGLKLG